MYEDQGNARTRGEHCKLITCILPDDGIHRKLLKDLRTNRKAVRASSQSGLGIDIFAHAEAKPGTLPDAYLVRIVQIVVKADEADELFEYVHAVAEINRPGGGVMMQIPLMAANSLRAPRRCSGRVEHDPQPRYSLLTVITRDRGYRNCSQVALGLEAAGAALRPCRAAGGACSAPAHARRRAGNNVEASARNQRPAKVRQESAARRTVGGCRPPAAITHGGARSPDQAPRKVHKVQIQPPI